MTAAITPTVDATRVAERTAKRFYVRMAATCIGVAVIGFAPTFWVPMARGSLQVQPVIYVHATFFFGWTLFLLAQTRIAASGNLDRHRALGVAGVAIATGMCFVGYATSISSLKRSEAAGFGEAARAFSIVSLSGIAFFAVLIAVALINFRKPDIHKRLMLVATISLLQAAIGRWFLLFLKPPDTPVGAVPPVIVTVGPAILTDLLIVAAMIHDRRTRGRVHSAYWIAGAVLLAVQLLRVPLSTSAGWSRTLDALVALSR